MFCGKCGTQIPDGAAFCPVCNNPVSKNFTVEKPVVTKEAVTEVPTEEAADVKAPAKKASTKVIVGLTVAVAAVVLAVILICIFAGGVTNDPADVATGFFEAVSDGDVENMLQFFPDKFIDAVIEKDYDGDRQTFLEEGKKSLSANGMISEGIGISISFEVGEINEPDEDERKECIDGLTKALKEGYDLELDISDVLIIDVKMYITTTFMGQEMNNTMQEDIELVKIGKKWYVSPEGLDL